jgi:hypothetical protein
MEIGRDLDDVLEVAADRVERRLDIFKHLHRLGRESNPIFTWVRLAQRVPVRIRIDQVPDGVRLAAGMTATVQVDPRPERPSN